MDLLETARQVGWTTLKIAPLILLSILVSYILLFSYVSSDTEAQTMNSQLLSDSLPKSNRMELSNWAINKMDILSKPLGSFYIATADNVSFSKFQFLTIPSVTNVLNALNMGARCIELSVYSHNDIPVIKYSNKLFSKKFTYLENTLDSIRCFATNKTSDPLIIYININDYKSKAYLQNINALIKKILGKSMYEYTFDLITDSTQYFPNVSINNLLNKIILVAKFEGVNKTNDDIIRFIYPVVHGVCTEQTGGWFTNTRYIMDSVSVSDPIKNITNSMVKLNTNGMSNYNPLPYYNSGYNLISMNYQESDYMDTYLDMFSVVSFIPKDTMFGGKLFDPVFKSQSIKYNERFYSDLYSLDQSSINIIKDGQSFVSAYWVNGEYTMKFINGNLSIYKDTKLKWSTKTDDYDDAILTMNDGNLEIHHKRTQDDPIRIIWDAKVKSNKGGYATLGSNGKLQIFNRDGKLLY